jgi:hypothetical protein
VTRRAPSSYGCQVAAIRDQSIAASRSWNPAEAAMRTGRPSALGDTITNA